MQLKIQFELELTTRVKRAREKEAERQEGSTILIHFFSASLGQKAYFTLLKADAYLLLKILTDNMYIKNPIEHIYRDRGLR